MKNRLSDLYIPEFKRTRTHTQVCKYKLTSLFLPIIPDEKYSGFYMHTHIYT